MSRIITATAGIALAVALATTASAQQTAATNSTDTAPAATASAAGQTGPSGTIQKSHGMWRASKLVGSTVYNQNGDSVGSVDDFLIDDSGKLTQAVISVGGFLGIGSKLVSVPFDQLHLEPSRRYTNGAATTGTTAGTAAGAGAALGTAAEPLTGSTTMNRPAGATEQEPSYFSIVLPDATKQTLTSAADFKYAG